MCCFYACWLLMCCVFFFFKQKTAYEMRISDGVQTCALPISMPAFRCSVRLQPDTKALQQGRECRPVPACACIRLFFRKGNGCVTAVRLSVWPYLEIVRSCIVALVQMDRRGQRPVLGLP